MQWRYCKRLTKHAFGDYQPAEFIYELFEGYRYIRQFKDETIVKRIVQEHNSHKGLLEACKYILKNNSKEDWLTDIEKERLKQAIAQAEE